MKDNTDLIEAYLNNEMLGDTLLNFEKRFATEPDLAQEIALHTQLKGFIKENEVQNLKSQVKNWLGEETDNQQETLPEYRLNSQKTKSIFSFNLLAKIAAGLVIVAGLSWYLFSNNNSQTIENQYYAELLGQNPAQLQGEDDRVIWAQAYREKNYKKSISILQNKSNPTAEESYYLALSLSADNQLEKALKQLSQNIIASSVYSEKAEWAKVLIYLKLYKKSEAKLLLKKIENSDSEFNEKARRIDL